MSAHKIRTRIWHEEPEPDNAFAAKAAYCHGYDVYGDMLGRASWSDMLYLLFRGEAPTRAQAKFLDAIAVALANPGPRDPSIHAAMCAGVGGSPAAASLMAALAVGAGQYTGAREVLLAMQCWSDCGTDLAAWRQRLTSPGTSASSIWPACECAPGFDPYGTSVTTLVRQTLDCLVQLSTGHRLSWLALHRESLERAVGNPLVLAGVAAAALADLGLSPDEGEMLYLLLRLPGAAVHALEQRANGYKNFPFFDLELQDDPAREAA